MKINQLNEVLSIYTKDNYKYADFDVKGLYDTIKPANLHVITKDEMDAVKNYIGITGEETEEELRAIRNTIVRYCADKSDETNSYDEILWDQMSAFTHVIDTELYNKFGYV